ncbi:MAG: hypothetical protein FWC68_05725 [Oscillospiraceae bacterium]|nr:hypothetical protein [Oscillospiraceae bacterium]
MEGKNEQVAEVNMVKGILFALGGAAVGFGLWLAVIALFAIGTGGAIGGAFAGGLGGLVATAYYKGAGKSGAVGYGTVVIIAIVGTFAALALGVAIYLYNEGVASSVGAGFDLIFDNDDLRSAFMQDMTITGIITVGASVWTLKSMSKEVVEEASKEENEKTDNEE